MDLETIAQKTRILKNLWQWHTEIEIRKIQTAVEGRALWDNLDIAKRALDTNLANANGGDLALLKAGEFIRDILKMSFTESKIKILEGIKNGY